jgi:hypothetical protein
MIDLPRAVSLARVADDQQAVRDLSAGARRNQVELASLEPKNWLVKS